MLFRSNDTATTEIYTHSDTLSLHDALPIRAQAKPFKLGGETFELPAPTGWPDEVLQAANDDDVIGAARLVLGTDNYDRFLAAGGSALLLQDLVAKLHKAQLGESVGSSSS